jgi:DNA-binding XRE family transcriptional regulator
MMENDMARSYDEFIARTMSPAQLQRAKKLARKVREEYVLSELRKKSGKTQRELAKAIGIKQPSLSKLEKQADMQLSTLKKFVNALGGELELIARFPRGRVRLGQFRNAVKRSKQKT